MMKPNQIGILKQISHKEKEVNCRNCHYFISAVSAAGGGHCWKHKFYLSFPESSRCEDFIKTEKEERRVKPLFGFKSFIYFDL